MGFGAFVAITSVAGAVIGVLAWNGWLAIIYGTLGLTMGVAGIVGVWTRPPLRSALFGWFRVGIAGRAIVEGGLYLWLPTRESHQSWSRTRSAILPGISRSGSTRRIASGRLGSPAPRGTSRAYSPLAGGREAQPRRGRD